MPPIRKEGDKPTRCLDRLVHVLKETTTPGVRFRPRDVELLIQQYDVGDDVGLLLKCPVASVLMKAWLEGYLLRDEERSGCALAYYYVKPDGMPRDEAIQRAMQTSDKLRRDRKERNVDHNLRDTMDGRKGIDRRRLNGNKR